MGLAILNSRKQFPSSMSGFQYLVHYFSMPLEKHLQMSLSVKEFYPGELTWASKLRWTREELLQLVKRGSPRGGSSGSPENEVGAGQCCESVGFEHSSIAATAKFRLCFLLSRPGHSGRRRQSIKMPQTLPRRPENSLRPTPGHSLNQLVNSLATPSLASLTHLRSARAVSP